MFTVKGIDHIVLRTTDVPRLIAFYRDVLDCPVEKVQERLGLYQLRAGASLIDIVDVAGPLGRAGGVPPGDEGRNLDHFCLRIEPFEPETLRVHLAAHGVDAGDPAPRYGADGTGPSIYINDPDGNTVELKGPPAPEKGV